ncbi:Similar to UPF0364 protein C806.04c; acc. no. Q9UT55 [Pyronema omphalodes CBS 100304]|uniref:Sugar phosphate phosphatase n=1 Tax=Pyronema omphalodes (strain CBS 100304) TaxID=1076935 RepID=U4LV44_PYROM|nr:Similar to UPF0364 protein C806.04c; acc. no. Q9UT55 [Pyronema omphalodes CBS 100304]
MAYYGENDTKTELYSTADKSSFAFTSAIERWPVIITQVITDIFQTTNALPETNDTEKQRVKEGRAIVTELTALKYQLGHDYELLPIIDDGFPDVALYNAELAGLAAREKENNVPTTKKNPNGNPTWHKIAWLYSECYLYRRISSMLKRTEQWKEYDPFHATKNTTFRSSLTAVMELASKYKEITEKLRAGVEPDLEKEKLLFLEMAEICLWGNATDLSLLTSLTYEDIQKLQGSEARKKAENNILSNNLPSVFSKLQQIKESGKGSRRVDIVLDNSGFELFVDLVLAGYLLESGLATEIVFHPKDLPWFVSDVMPVDLHDLLAALADPVPYFSQLESAPKITDAQQSDLRFLATTWKGFLDDGRFKIRTDRFWTLPGSYWRLPACAPELFEELKTSELVIFKGDLNYRKLTGDAMWDPTTKFEEAIGPLGKEASGVRVLALRTCKADVVVGLPVGKDEELRQGDKARTWGWSGKWAVCQWWDGKA